MKQITFDQKHLMPKLFMSVLMLLSLSVFSMFAVAAQPETSQTGRDFNHMNTGFPLTGLHTTAECGSCHVGGVFKGTPRTCSGCHSKGMRVVATPKSAKHLVTTEPCEVCHSNTVTFYGARYNHGKAVVGQCTSCHNGLIATGRAASHTTGSKLTKSCDSCHRTYAWLPASWNHSGAGSCVTCHVTGGDGAAFVKTAIAGTSAEAFAHNAQNNGISCESCHSSYTSWYGAIYNHSGAGSVCSSCHNSSRATGTAQKSGHVAVGTDECSACHTGTRSWLPALGAKPANHILYTTTSCSTCHVGSTVVKGATLHAYVSSSCKTCHNSTATYLGNMKKKTLGSHEGSSTAQDCNSSGCHSTSYTSWNR
jgi:hypothetical protein